MSLLGTVWDQMLVVVCIVLIVPFVIQTTSASFANFPDIVLKLRLGLVVLIIHITQVQLSLAIFLAAKKVYDALLLPYLMLQVLNFPAVAHIRLFQ
mgnify:CR=1 FL=1